MGNKAILNILTISFLRAFRGLGLNKNVSSRYKGVHEETRKLKARKQKEEEKNLANNFFFFLLKSISIVLDHQF